jgi:tRNA(Ile)-lysidine synthase
MKEVELESRVKGFVQRNSLIVPGGTVVVGVSGGADSVCLLHVLAKLQGEIDIRLHLAHFDHRLRGAESQADMRYVGSLATSLGIPITTGSEDVASYKARKNCSLEEAARELRYGFLARVASSVGADRVAVGHTQDDHVETILMHILRGTGTSGLRGLGPCSPIVYDRQSRAAPSGEPFSSSLRAEQSNLLIIRPLLGVTREETMDYCQELDLEPRVDSSNLSLSFLRNRCRLELLPLLRKYNPDVGQALLRLAGIAGDDGAFIERHAVQLWNEVARQTDGAVYLDKGKVSALPVALQRQLIRLAGERLLGDTRDIEASHIEAMRLLLAKPVGKRVSLPRGLICWAGYDKAVIAREGQQFQAPFPPCPFPSLQGEFPLEVPGETIMPGWHVMASISAAIGYRSSGRSGLNRRFAAGSEARQSQEEDSELLAEFDLHQTGTELFVRQRQPADMFYPLGMDRAKKLQHFMADAKIPLWWRDRIPIVCSPRQIVWVAGWRIDDRVKVAEATGKILRLKFVQSS